jgi:hypothetical protein
MKNNEYSYADEYCNMPLKRPCHEIFDLSSKNFPKAPDTRVKAF